MPVQQEIKSQLAKLLATEDIVVEHKNVETAQFNTDTRVLILPIWEKASNDVYDMLVGHEVGHALFTPNEDPPNDIPHSFLNVCEDARIEKLMKRKYMGLAKSFYRGYSEMHEEDFFELDGEDIDSFTLADRANLYFKIGSFLDLSFSDAEKEIITLIQNAETFTETIAAAEALYNFCKQEQETQQKTQELPTENQEGLGEDMVDEFPTGNSESSGDSDSDNTGDIDSSISNPDSDGSVESGNSASDLPSGSSDYDADPLELKTANSLEQKLKDLVNTHSSLENEYIEIPKVNLDSVIIDNKKVHAHIEETWDTEYERNYEKYHSSKEFYDSHDYFGISENCFEIADRAYREFKKDAQKEVNYLVKEFECKKAASAYARASTARTGVLDTRNLHTYKFNEDLFKKITVLPDGKNHGLIFILDWSGSMSRVIGDTLKQLYNLIWFCRKVNIPFEVYAFTYEWFRAENVMDYSLDVNERREARKEKGSHCERKENEFHIEKEFNLMNFFTSNVNGKELENQMINIWRIAHVMSSNMRSPYTYPHALHLSGTPLNESLVTLHQIIPDFQKKNKVEKVQCIMLTDGEANTLPFNRKVERHWEDEPFLGTQQASGRCILRDRKLGKTYNMGYGYFEFTGALLRHMQDKFFNTNFIGIRVLEPRDAKHFIRMHCDGHDMQAYHDWAKTRTFTIKTAGYDAYFGLSATALADDSEFDVDDGATKAQIKRAFVKSLKTKKLNKKVLGEFISLVA